MEKSDEVNAIKITNKLTSLFTVYSSDNANYHFENDVVKLIVLDVMLGDGESIQQYQLRV